MNTNENYEEYQIGIFELITEIYLAENIIINYKTTMGDLSSPMYALYKRYKKCNKKHMTARDLDEYIRENYLDDYIVLKNGVVIAKSKTTLEEEMEDNYSDFMLAHLRDNKRRRDEINDRLASIDELINMSTEEVVDELELIEPLEEDNDIYNKIEVIETHDWMTIKSGELYKALEIYNYKYKGLIFSKINILMIKTDPVPSQLHDYPYDLTIHCSIDYLSARQYFNSPPADISGVALGFENSHKAIDGASSFSNAINLIVDYFLDMACTMYGGLKE